MNIIDIITFSTDSINKSQINSREIIALQKSATKEQKQKVYEACLQNCAAQSALKADILFPRGPP